MENKKNKKKLFAIIGASALAFILTVALSVSITLAYFGSTGSGKTTVTLGGSVEVGTALTMTGNVTGAVPGQKVALSVEGKVKSSSTQNAAVILLVDNANVTAAADKGWVKVGTATKDTTTYQVYVLGTSDAMTVLALTTTDSAVAKFEADYTISTALTNEDADKEVAAAQLNAIMIAVQNGTEDTAKAKSFATLKPIFEEVGKITITVA